MSKILAALAVVTAAALLGAGAGHAIKPAQSQPKAALQPAPKQAVPPTCPASALPATGTLGTVAAGVHPTGAGVPAALAGFCWVGAGGNLCNSAAATTVPGQTIFPGLLPNSTISYQADPANGIVYFTICKFG